MIGADKLVVIETYPHSLQWFKTLTKCLKVHSQKNQSEVVSTTSKFRHDFVSLGLANQTIKTSFYKYTCKILKTRLFREMSRKGE